MRIFIYAVFLLNIIIYVHKPTIVYGKELSNEYVKAEIYCISWDIVNRTRVSIDYVRNSFEVKIIIRDKPRLNNLLDWLRLDELHKLEEPYLDNPRFVIDLYTHDNKIKTYYAGLYYLMTEDSLKARKVDEEFYPICNFMSKSGAPWSK